MARNFKQGIDYFPLDIVLDDKWDLIEAEFGNVGFAILIKLLQKIYKEGYFYAWGEKEKLLFSKRVSTETSMIERIVERSAEWEFFNESILKKHKVLTSRGIQKRYFEIVKRRKSITIIKEYMLVDINDYMHDDNVDIYSINDDKNEQSTVQERTEEESRGDNTSEKYSDSSLRVAQLLLKKIVSWDPGHKYSKKPPSLGKWCMEIDRAKKLDGRTEEQLINLIEYIFDQNTDVANFWKPNVQSGKKLREKFDKIKGQKNYEIDKHKNSTASRVRSDQETRYREELEASIDENLFSR